MSEITKKERRLFGEYLEESYGSEGDFDEMAHIVTGAWVSLRELTPDLGKHSVRFQYAISVSCALIAIETKRHYMNENRPLSLPDPNKKFPHSIDWGYESPKTIEISSSGNRGRRIEGPKSK